MTYMDDLHVRLRHGRAMERTLRGVFLRYQDFTSHIRSSPVFLIV